MKNKSKNQRAAQLVRNQGANEKVSNIFDLLDDEVDFNGPNAERRTFAVSELRVVDSAGGPVVEGHAAVFDKLSEDLGGWQEKISPGAFRQAIKDSDIRALFNHDPNFVLGRTSNKTLTVKEDKEGLLMRVDMPDTQIIRDLVLAPIKRGDIREQSFGFIVKEDEWQGLEEDERKKKPPVRTIKKVSRLFDVSPVTFPAYPDTDVAVRSLHQAIKKVEERGGFQMVNPVEELILNSLANLEEFKEVFKEKDEDEIRDHFKQLVMNLVAFISPDTEFDNYDELITKIEPETVIEPTQDPNNGSNENLTSAEPMRSEDSNGNNEEPTSSLNDSENENKNLTTVLIRQFCATPVAEE